MLAHKRKMNRDGEVMTSQIVKWVLIVVAFVVLIFVVIYVFGGFSGSATDKEVCHQSIVVRATARAGAFDLTEGIPLKCKTEKVCLSLSGGDCEELISTKDSKVKKIKLSSCGSDGGCNEARKEIMGVFADKMIRCHDMLGEGKLNFFPHKSFKDDSYLPNFDNTKYGLICTRIVFDNEAKEKIGSIGYLELYQQLERKVVDDGNGIEYLYPGIERATDFIKIHEFARESETRENVKYGTLSDPKDWAINPSEENGYAIVAGMTEAGQGGALVEAAGVIGIVGGVLLWSGLVSPVGALLLAGSAGSAYFLYKFDDTYLYSPPSIFHFDVKKLESLGFYSFEIVS
jgi:hypothetical protein